jgi:predicted TIM-barrel fold metal-dependent hydrolase
VQFYTGLGDSDNMLTNASPAHLQLLIVADTLATFVLLHSSYPYTREASYLIAVYKNVYLDIGEVFPMVSGSGQGSLVRQAFKLELAPKNKVHQETCHLLFWARTSRKVEKEPGPQKAHP